MPNFEKLSVRREETSSKVYFSFSGTFKAEDISDIMQIPPTEYFNKGDTLHRNFSSWCYGTEYENTRDIEEQCTRIVNVLCGKISEIKDILQKYDCAGVFQIVSVIEYGETPVLHFNKDVVNFCSETGIEIDVDTYVNPYLNDYLSSEE